MKGKKRFRRRLLTAVCVLLAVGAVLTGAFFWYVSDYYRAEDVALAVLAGDDGVEVRDGLTILSPSYPTDTALIFYPGAKVEAAAGFAALRVVPYQHRLLLGQGRVAEEIFDVKGLARSGPDVLCGEGVPPPVVALFRQGTFEHAVVPGNVTFVHGVVPRLCLLPLPYRRRERTGEEGAKC